MSNSHMISKYATPVPYPTLVLSRFHHKRVLGTTMLKQALTPVECHATLDNALWWLDYQPHASVEIFLVGRQVETDIWGEAMIESAAIREHLRRHPAAHPTACFIRWCTGGHLTPKEWLQEYGFHGAMPHAPANYHLGDAVVELREKVSDGAA